MGIIKKRKGENDMGKPINYDTKYMFRIDKKLLEEVKIFCNSKGITVSDFIRDCLNKGMEYGRKQ